MGCASCCYFYRDSPHNNSVKSNFTSRDLFFNVIKDTEPHHELADNPLVNFGCVDDHINGIFSHKTCFFTKLTTFFRCPPKVKGISHDGFLRCARCVVVRDKKNAVRDSLFHTTAQRSQRSLKPAVVRNNATSSAHTDSLSPPVPPALPFLKSA